MSQSKLGLTSSSSLCAPCHFSRRVWSFSLFYCSYQVLRADGSSVWEQQSRQVIQFTFWVFSWLTYQDRLAVSEQVGVWRLSYCQLLPVIISSSVMTVKKELFLWRDYIFLHEPLHTFIHHCIISVITVQNQCYTVAVNYNDHSSSDSWAFTCASVRWWMKLWMMPICLCTNSSVTPACSSWFEFLLLWLYLVFIFRKWIVPQNRTSQQKSSCKHVSNRGNEYRLCFKWVSARFLVCSMDTEDDWHVLVRALFYS